MKASLDPVVDILLILSLPVHPSPSSTSNGTSQEVQNLMFKFGLTSFFKEVAGIGRSRIHTQLSSHTIQLPDVLPMSY